MCDYIGFTCALCPEYGIFNKQEWLAHFKKHDTVRAFSNWV